MVKREEFRITGIEKKSQLNDYVWGEIEEIRDCRKCGKLTFGNSLNIHASIHHKSNVTSSELAYETKDVCCGYGQENIRETIARIRKGLGDL